MQNELHLCVSVDGVDGVACALAGRNWQVKLDMQVIQDNALIVSATGPFLCQAGH